MKKLKLHYIPIQKYIEILYINIIYYTKMGYDRMESKTRIILFIIGIVLIVGCLAGGITMIKKGNDMKEIADSVGSNYKNGSGTITFGYILCIFGSMIGIIMLAFAINGKK